MNLMNESVDQAAAARLREAREKAGFEGPADAARYFGWSEHTYKSHENGNRGIRLPAARKYAQAFKTTAVWILHGQDVGRTLPDRPQVAAIPVIGIASAGVFRTIEWEPEVGTVIPAIPKPGVELDAQYAVRVDGPSVNRRIPDGMFAICVRYDAYPGEPAHGQLVHVIRERAGLREHTIKELRYERAGRVLWPCSDHPDHQEPINIEAPEDDTVVHIAGVVIGKFEPL